jgi:hypothetical protein
LAEAASVRVAFRLQSPDLVRIATALVMLLGFAASAGCSTTIEPESDPGRSDPLSDDYDLCAESGWYGDGVCDVGCAEPDSDCMPEECDETCADVCDAAWSGAPLPAVADGCTADPIACDCGDAPVECPDVCEAECSGLPVPEVPADCPDVGTCDCAEVLPESDEPTAQVQPMLLPAGEGGGACATPVGASGGGSATTATVSVGQTAWAASRPSTIPIAFHVVRTSGPADVTGNVSRRLLVKQLRILNRAYAHTAFRFRIKMITRTTNRSWFYSNLHSSTQQAMKNALRRGGRGTLNVWSVYGGTGSFGTYPWWIEASPEKDGIVHTVRSLPGGENAPYDKGDLLVHETGHWLGLFHTYEYGCGKNHSDGVKDTPAEASKAGTCNERRDSCPGESGRDPVHNYMDQAGDACANQFTRGQRTRMKTMAVGWRGIGARASASGGGGGGGGCGDGVCDGDETDASCAADCGCAAVSCDGIAPIGCYCDAACAQTGDCCADADSCQE